MEAGVVSAYYLLTACLFKKMLPKEIEYESCYWGQIISLKQGALSCGNLVAHATMAGEGAGSCAPKCGSGATEVPHMVQSPGNSDRSLWGLPHLFSLWCSISWGGAN